MQAVRQGAIEHLEVLEQLEVMQAKSASTGDEAVLPQEHSGVRQSETPTVNPLEAVIGRLETEAAKAKAKAAELEMQLTEAQRSCDTAQLTIGELNSKLGLSMTQVEQAENDRDTAETEVEELRTKVMNLEMQAPTGPNQQVQQLTAKFQREIDTLKEKLESAVLYEILPKGKKLSEAFFEIYETLSKVEGRLRETQMPQPSDFDTLDREKVRREIAALEQQRAALRTDLKASFWSIFEYLKKALNLVESDLMGFFRLSVPMFEEQRKLIAVKNNTLPLKSNDIAKVERLVSRGQPTGAGAVSISGSAQDASKVIAKGQAGADDASDDPVAGIMKPLSMPPQSRVPTFSERSDMGESASSRIISPP